MGILAGTWHRFRRLAGREPKSVTLDVLTGYAQWARTYPAEAHNPLMAVEERAMLELLPDVAGKACLDLACGSGRYLRWLQARAPRFILGADYSAEMLAQAHKTVTTFRLVRSPFQALPFAAETFDVITCGLGVGHAENLDRVLAEAARVLRPGGCLVYSDFHPFGALAGWQRSFTGQNGRVYHLEHYVHLYSDHLAAGRAAGLTIEAVLEPTAPEHVPAGFEKLPVVLAIRAGKDREAGTLKMEDRR